MSKLKVTINGVVHETDAILVEWENRPLAVKMNDTHFVARLFDDNKVLDTTEMDLVDFAEAMALDLSDENIEMALGEDQDEDGEMDDEDDSEEEEEE